MTCKVNNYSNNNSNNNFNNRYHYYIMNEYKKIPSL